MKIIRKRILLVDDDRDIIDSLTLILESAGYEITSVDSGMGCLELLATEQPDLIVLDVMMETNIEGLKVANRLKTYPAYRSLPILMISSLWKQGEWNVLRDESTVDRFIQKPISPKELLKNIEELVTA